MSASRFFIALFAVSLSFAGAAQAHEVRPAYLRIEPTDEQLTSEDSAKIYNVLWKRPIVDDGTRLTPTFPNNCVASPTALNEVVGPVIVSRIRLDCEKGLLDSEISIRGIELAITEVMLHVTLSDGETASYLLNSLNPSIVVTQTGAPVWSYLSLGFEHLLFGVDHILFVIALMFFVTRIGVLIKTITAFTLAHSITLALSALELVYLPQQPVEAVIALSILFLAVERLRETPEKANPESIVRNQTWIVAFAFGLLHGFGFAGALADIGLPKGNLIGALFLFNIGVELGQLLVIVVGLCIAWIIRRVWLSVPRFIVYAPMYVVGSTAAYWVVERSVGIFW